MHSAVGTAANQADINQTAYLLHGQEEAVFADAGYTGANMGLLQHADMELLQHKVHGAHIIRRMTSIPLRLEVA